MDKTKKKAIIYVSYVLGISVIITAGIILVHDYRFYVSGIFLIIIGIILFKHFLKKSF